MKIKNIHIDNFGKFENFNIDFKDDIQIIYGENEAGKSTLMDFIKLMFYRKEGYEKASAKDKEIREKYLYNISNSAEVGASYIINRLIEYSKR